MIGDAASIGMVALDREVGTVMEQAIEDMHRLTGSGRDDSGMERRVAVRDMGVEGDGGIAALVRVDCARRSSGKFCPSELEAVPLPNFSATGIRCCASASLVSAAP
ncbi:hypothetical protein NS258_18485 [Sphingomonas sanguinis]|uniref:Uncharacterized protein n=1 Tax=Sphingomonas sanguinis TaxID=33051 RepID=A0A147J1L6_9SPHN|nr:hypothetical protein NS258_18485 [Sphingomonas sanguinis]